MTNTILPISKIIIIFAVAIFLIGFFFPYYEYPNDSRGYGLYAMRLVSGEYEFSSELLSSTGKNEFVPASWIKTPHNTAIPDSMPGIAVLGSIFYKIGGEAGLFYLGPIFAILFLIASERIATKIFGPYIGFLTLCFLATNEIFFWVGRGLLTSNIFSLLFIIGFYFMIQFLSTKNIRLLFLSSLFLMIPSFFRLNGIIVFPIEIGIISSYFILKYFYNLNKGKNENKSETIYQIKRKKIQYISKISLAILIPWLIFFGTFMVFNNYYFDNPMTSIYTATEKPRINLESEQNKNNLFDSERMKKYLNHFLPYPINRISDIETNAIVDTNLLNETSSTSYFINLVSNYNLGIITLLVILIALIFTVKNNENKIFVISSSVFILFFILFYSFEPIAENRQGSGRDMLPIIPLFFMMFSYMILNIFKEFSKQKYKSKIISSFPRFGSIIFLIIIIPTAFYFADYSQILKNDGFVFKDPSEFDGKFPVDFEGISQDSVIFTYYQTWSVVGYGAIPFTPSWDDDLDEEHYNKLASTLREIISNEKEVYIFKDPKLEEEKVFYDRFFSKTNLILKDYSESFCMIIIEDNSEMTNDKECIT